MTRLASMTPEMPASMPEMAYTLKMVRPTLMPAMPAAIGLPPIA